MSIKDKIFLKTILVDRKRNFYVTLYQSPTLEFHVLFEWPLKIRSLNREINLLVIANDVTQKKTRNAHTCSSSYLVIVDVIVMLIIKLQKKQVKSKWGSLHAGRVSCPII